MRAIIAQIGYNLEYLSTCAIIVDPFTKFNLRNMFCERVNLWIAYVMICVSHISWIIIYWIQDTLCLIK